jgi:hypothetical protein
VKSKKIAPKSRSGSKIVRAAIERLENRQLLSVSLNAAGFTVVTPSSDSRLIYVSSTGSDTLNTGLSPSSPYASISKAYGLLRNGYPDWILFRRGDTFTGNFPKFADSGRSQQEPMVVTDYGDTSLPRPVFDSGANNAFVTGPSNQYLDVIGINFTSSTRNPSSPNFNGQGQGNYGFDDTGGTNNLLIEDCSFSYFTFDIQFTGYYAACNNITIRRNEILDAYSDNTTAHSSGMYADTVNGLTIQDNVFDHNGWNTSVSGATATIYNHNCYLHSSNNSVVVTNNVFADGSSFGLQARAGGVVDNNVFINNAHAMSYGLVNGATTKAGGVSGEMIGNVFLPDRNDPSGWGFGAVIGNLKPGGNTVISNNIFANGNGPQAALYFQPGQSVANPTQEVGLNSVTVSNNIVYDWGFGLYISSLYVPGSTGANGFTAVTIKNNVFNNNVAGRIILHGPAFSSSNETWSGNSYASTGSSAIHWFQLQGVDTAFSTWQSAHEPTAISGVPAYVDPTRSVSSYMASKGLTTTLAAYISGLRAQSATNWNSVYFASSIGGYIQAGFALPGAGMHVSLTGAAAADANASYTLSIGAVTDPGFTVSQEIVHWGDGTSTTYNTDGTAPMAVQHLYGDRSSALSTAITIDIVDNGGSAGASRTSLAVASLPVTLNATASMISTVSGSATTSAGAGVPGVTIYLDANNNRKLDAGELSAVTDSTGAYSITNVPSAALIVRQILPAGDTQVSPSGGLGIHITVNAGNTLTNENFIDTAPNVPTTGTVTGTVTDSNSTPISGVTVFIDGNGNNTFDNGELFGVTTAAALMPLPMCRPEHRLWRRLFPRAIRRQLPQPELEFRLPSLPEERYPTKALSISSRQPPEPSLAS